MLAALAEGVHEIGYVICPGQYGMGSSFSTQEDQSAKANKGGDDTLGDKVTKQGKSEPPANTELPVNIPKVRASSSDRPHLPLINFFYCRNAILMLLHHVQTTTRKMKSKSKGRS